MYVEECKKEGENVAEEEENIQEYKKKKKKKKTKFFLNICHDDVDVISVRQVEGNALKGIIYCI